VKVERDARAKEKGEAEKAAEELKQQLSAQGSELEKERKERVAGAERLKSLQSDCALLQHELASYAAVLKRVQKSRDDHAQARYGLAQQINELKSELTLKNGALQDERSKAGDAAEQIKALMAKLAGVKGERDVQAKEKDEAREEAELTLLQLHQVQEELERYFLESRAQDDLLRQHQTQSLAMRQALSRLIAARS
jgi:chromosome segregation ATPase